MELELTEQQQQDSGGSGDGNVVPFACLPIELYPLIFDFLQHRSQNLSRLCSVNKKFNQFSTPLLYQRLFLRDQSKLIKVFHSLSQHHHLSKHVQVLELKGYPFSLPAEQLEKLEENIVGSIERMVNLKSLSWTRSGSLNDRVLRTIFDNLLNLQSLDITGDSRTYSPQLLLEKLRPEIKLKQFSIQYPDKKFVATLPKLCQRLGKDLKSLLVHCDSSTLVNDTVFIEISQHLVNLERLSIVGCRSVTEVGVEAFLTSSQVGIRELAIEGLAVHPKSLESMSKHLSSLKLLSLTHPRSSVSSSETFYQSLCLIFPNLSSLEEFTLYAPNQANIADDILEAKPEEADSSENEKVYSGPKLPSSFLRTLLEHRGCQLRKLRIFGIAVSNEQLGWICGACTLLRDMAIQLFQGEKSILFSNLSRLPNLQFLHILSNASAELNLTEEEIRDLASECSDKLENIGFRHRVWIVHRVPFTPQEAEERVRKVGKRRECRVELRKWDLSSGRWPEVVLVVRS